MRAAATVHPADRSAARAHRPRSGRASVIALVGWRVRPVAGALLLACRAWVSFAGALTVSPWRRNPGLL